MNKFLAIFLLVAVAVIAFASPVLAQGENPPVTSEETLPPPPVQGAEVLEFGGLLIAITAFFKKQLDLHKNQVMIAAFFVGLFLWFAPQLGNLIPAAAVYLNGFVSFVTVYLAAMGSVDFLINTGAKIATATATSVA